MIHLLVNYNNSTIPKLSLIFFTHKELRQLCEEIEIFEVVDSRNDEE